MRPTTHISQKDICSKKVEDIRPTDRCVLTTPAIPTRVHTTSVCHDKLKSANQENNKVSNAYVGQQQPESHATVPLMHWHVRIVILANQSKYLLLTDRRIWAATIRTRVHATSPCYMSSRCRMAGYLHRTTAARIA